MLSVPTLLGTGNDYLELEYLERVGECAIEQIIRGVSGLYYAMPPDGAADLFPTVDLSTKKLLHRLDYIPAEMEKRGIGDPELLDSIALFVKRDYVASEHRCLVHGDLKSPHAIPTKLGLKFIDLELFCVASPWYDLAFLILEQRSKIQAIDEIAEVAARILGKHFGTTTKEVRQLLHSATVYRAFYNLGFALRHRPDNSIKRTISELRELLSA